MLPIQPHMLQLLITSQQNFRKSVQKGSGIHGLPRAREFSLMHTAFSLSVLSQIITHFG